MRCTASAAAALRCGSSRCKALKHGGQRRRAWDRWTVEVWSVHMWWWRCQWCAGMLIAVMKIWYSSCPDFERPSVVWHQTDIFFNTLVLFETEWSWQCPMRKIQLSVRIYLSWTSNQIVFIVLLLLSNQQRVKLSRIVKNWVSNKVQWKLNGRSNQITPERIGIERGAQIVSRWVVQVIVLSEIFDSSMKEFVTGLSEII